MTEMSPLQSEHLVRVPLSLLALAVERVSESVCITDADLDDGPKIVLVNAAFTALTGYAPSEVLGRTPRFLQGPRTSPEMRARLRRALFEGRPFKGEAVNYRRDGREFLMHLDVVPLCDDLGRPTHFLAMGRDITEEREAKTFGQLFRAALDQTTDAIAIVDERCRTLYANPSFVLMSGQRTEELVGADVRATGIAPRRARVCREVIRALSGEHTREHEWRGEYEAATPAGEGRRLAVTVTRVELGEPKAQFVVAARDVTHQRRLEYIAEANNLVENVGYVFASLRHELGNPVNSIKTALTVMRQSLRALPPERVEDYLDRVLHEVGRVEYLLRSLQSFDPSTRPTLESVPIAPFLRRFADLIRPDVEMRDVTLGVQADDSVGAALADPRALHQVMLNLVTNAIDALTGRPGGAIRISAQRGSHVRILVTDNGPGIRPERRAQLFRPFHTTKAKGTGLGLAITRKLVTLMHGTIEHEPAPGGGAIFAVSLDPGEAVAAERRVATQRPPPLRAVR